MTAAIIKLAIQEALKPNPARYSLGAVIFKGKRIISSARNEKRSSNHLHPRFKKTMDSLCCERGAILKARTDLKGASIFVCRVTPGGQLRLAKPCSFCTNYMHYVGIKTVFYTSDEGLIVKASLGELYGK